MFLLYSPRLLLFFFFFFSSRRRHTRFDCDWSSDVCSSDVVAGDVLHCHGTVAGVVDDAGVLGSHHLDRSALHVHFAIVGGQVVDGHCAIAIGLVQDAAAGGCDDLQRAATAIDGHVACIAGQVLGGLATTRCHVQHAAPVQQGDLNAGAIDFDLGAAAAAAAAATAATTHGACHGSCCDQDRKSVV